MAAVNVLRIICVGDSGVGKSCLIKTFLGDPFQQESLSTIGVDFELIPMTLNVGSDARHVNLQIWDTAGQERFRTITTSYYRSADALLLVFDVTDATSFNNLELWMEDVRLYANPRVDIMLVGNKVDKTPRAVSFEVAKKYAEDHKFMYFETSAKQDVNVEKVFRELATITVMNKQAHATGSASGSSGSSSSGASGTVKLGSGGTDDDGPCAC